MCDVKPDRCGDGTHSDRVSAVTEEEEEEEVARTGKKIRKTQLTTIYIHLSKNEIAHKKKQDG